MREGWGEEWDWGLVLGARGVAVGVLMFVGAKEGRKGVLV